MQLIDKTELLRTLEQDINVSVTGAENMKAVQKCLQEILDDVKESPVVDAVPVVRCKDCKHHYYHELLKQDYCEIPNMQFGEIDPNGYCHRAERKKE